MTGNNTTSPDEGHSSVSQQEVSQGTLLTAPLLHARKDITGTGRTVDPMLRESEDPLFDAINGIEG